MGDAPVRREALMTVAASTEIPELPHNVIRLAEARVRLHPSTAQGDCEATADHVDADGVSLRDAADLDLGRFVWMDLDLPDGDPVRALGEVLPRDPTSVALDIKFKHLFPDPRRRLLRALEG